MPQPSPQAPSPQPQPGAGRTPPPRRCAYLTFVAIDAEGRPHRVPPLLLETDDERKRSADPHRRRADRLARKRERLSGV